MFNFKLSPLWLLGIILIVLTISMIWYNNASIEGFGAKPADGTGVLTHYPDAANSLFDFGTESTTKNYFDTNTGNIIREYGQSITVIDRAGNKRKFFKDDIESEILVENDEIHKGSTYGAFSLYEEDDDEQLFYISVGTTTFIHSIDLSDNKHGPTCVFDTSSLLRKETATENIAGIVIQTPLPSFSMNTASLDISGIIVTNAMDFTGGIYYDPSAQLMILKTTNDADVQDGPRPMRVTGSTTTDDGGGGGGGDGGGGGGEEDDDDDDDDNSGFTLFNNRFTKEELEGFTTEASTGVDTYTWDIYNRLGIQIMENSFVRSEYAPSTNSSDPKVQIFKTKDGNLQVVMMTQQERTVILALTNEGTGTTAKNKYKLLGIRRYIGKNLEQPTTTPSTPNYTPGEDSAEEEEEEEGQDISDSAMSEYWKWFHYWNADGGGAMGGTQPMSQDYMLKTDYVPMACPSCSGNCPNGNCSHVNGGSGGIVGTTGSVANNLIDKTSGIVEKTLDTGTDLALGGAILGAAAAKGAADLGKDAVKGATDLGKDAVKGAADLGKDATKGAVGIGREVAGGAAGIGRGAINLGREVVGGAIGLGKDAVGGTADFIKDSQYARAGGYASGSNGDIRTRKYVSGQNVVGGMDPYTYNGALAKRGGSNFMPLTSDFSSFR